MALSKANIDRLIRDRLGLEPNALGATLRNSERRGRRRLQRSRESSEVRAMQPHFARFGLANLLRVGMSLSMDIGRSGPIHVRLKGDRDDRRGGYSDSRAANFALLLACGLVQEEGRPLTILPPLECQVREAQLLEAAHRVKTHHPGKLITDLNTYEDDVRSLTDACASDHVHIGRDEPLLAALHLLREVGCAEDCA